MKFLIVILVSFVAALDVTYAGRFKRQFPMCTNSQVQSVAQCFMPQRQCNGNYYCDTTGYCCKNPSSLVATFPQCPNGLSSVAGCINGGCNQGYQCNTVGTQQVCCQVCPSNATSSGTCPTGSCAANFICINGLCCPGTVSSMTMSTISAPPTTPSSIPTLTTPGSTPTLTTPRSTPTLTTPRSTPTIQPTGCANNAPSVGTCSATTACADSTTQTCQGTVCCPICPDGSQSPGLCVSNSCSGFPAASLCSQGICCPNSSQGSCPAGQSSVGQCLPGTEQCPGGFTCISGFCCGTFSKPVSRNKF